MRFDNGAASYIEVLYAENELFSAELVAVNVQAERYAQLIAVYQSVGGGWVDAADAIALPPKGDGK
jgi:outer membrane protein, multidrug efflux system